MEKPTKYEAGMRFRVLGDFGGREWPPGAEFVVDHVSAYGSAMDKRDWCIAYDARLTDGTLEYLGMAPDAIAGSTQVHGTTGATALASAHWEVSNDGVMWAHAEVRGEFAITMGHRYRRFVNADGTVKSTYDNAPPVHPAEADRLMAMRMRAEGLTTDPGPAPPAPVAWVPRIDDFDLLEDVQ